MKFLITAALAACVFTAAAPAQQGQSSAPIARSMTLQAADTTASQQRASCNVSTIIQKASGLLFICGSNTDPYRNAPSYFAGLDRDAWPGAAPETLTLLNLFAARRDGVQNEDLVILNLRRDRSPVCESDTAFPADTTGRCYTIEAIEFATRMNG